MIGSSSSDIEISSEYEVDGIDFFEYEVAGGFLGFLSRTKNSFRF